MTAEDVIALPIDRKIDIKEAIWADFRDRFDRMDVSPQQKDLLDRRRASPRRLRPSFAPTIPSSSASGTPVPAPCCSWADSPTRPTDGRGVCLPLSEQG